MVVAITAVTANHPPQPVGPRSGKPPFAADWTAPPTLAREVHAAVGSVPRLRALAGRNPGSSFVRLNLGLALFWQRDDAGAAAAWKQAKRAQPDTPSAVRAGDLLHPDSPQGLPQFQPSFARATTPVQRRLVRGVRFQQSGARLGPAGVCRRRSRGAAGSGRPGRGGCRALRQGSPGDRVRTPRAARATFSPRADGSFPPRTALHLARGLRSGAPRAPVGSRPSPENRIRKGS